MNIEGLLHTLHIRMWLTTMITKITGKVQPKYHKGKSDEHPIPEAPDLDQSQHLCLDQILAQSQAVSYFHFHPPPLPSILLISINNTLVQSGCSKNVTIMRDWNLWKLRHGVFTWYWAKALRSYKYPGTELLWLQNWFLQTQNQWLTSTIKQWRM